MEGRGVRRRSAIRVRARTFRIRWSGAAALVLLVAGGVVLLQQPRHGESVDLLAELAAHASAHGEEGRDRACERTQLHATTRTERVHAAAGQAFEETALIQLENRGDTPCARITALEKVITSRDGHGTYHELRQFDFCETSACGSVPPQGARGVGFIWDALLRPDGLEEADLEAPPAIAAPPGVYDVTVRLLSVGNDGAHQIYEVDFELEVSA